MANKPFEEEEDEVEEGAPPWMATYADLATLLLTFFVLLLSFASMDIENFQTALGSVREAMGVQFQHPGHLPGLTTSVLELSKRESAPDPNVLDVELVTRVRAYVRSRHLSDRVEVDLTHRGLVIRIREVMLFPPGSDQLVDGSEAPLDAVAEIASEISLPIWIEGHTDNQPIKTARFPSNWELSAARATAALRYLVEKGDVSAERIRVAGYADVRPVAGNDTAEGRAKNRRVEFIFIRPPKRINHDGEMQKRPVDRESSGSRAR